MDTKLCRIYIILLYYIVILYFLINYRLTLINKLYYLLVSIIWYIVINFMNNT